VALGPLSYLVFWQVRFGEFWAPLDAQRNWQREPTFPLTAVWHALTLTWRYQTWWLIDVIVVGIAIAGVLVAAFRVPLTYTVYAGMSVLIPLTFTYDQRPLTSMPRFMAVVFPAWWGFAIAAERRRPPEAAFLDAEQGRNALVVRHRRRSGGGQRQPVKIASRAHRPTFALATGEV